MNKENIRKELLSVRKSINNKEELSTIIVNRILDLDIYQRSKVIALYNSFDNEVDTSYLIKKSLLEKIVLLPRIENDKMIFVKINNDTKYQKSNIGVMEPIGDVYSHEIDLIIVPGVSFDKNLNRLGFGKGYYDRFLSNQDIYKIGICFDKQLVNNLPVDNYDIKMDMVITEKKVLKKV